MDIIVNVFTKFAIYLLDLLENSVRFLFFVFQERDP